MSEDHETILARPQPTIEPPILQDGHAYTNLGTGTACPSVQNKDAGGQYIRVGCNKSTTSGRCYRGYFEWNITGLPVGKNVTNTMLDRLYVKSALSARNCHIVGFSAGFQPSANTAQNIWNDIQTNLDNNNIFVVDTNVFNTTGAKSVDLGSSADNDIYTRRNAGQTYWAIAIVYTSETRCSGADHLTTFSSNDNTTPSERPVLKITHDP
jgi:hypothetical protein